MEAIVREALEAALFLAREDLAEQDAAIARLERELVTRRGFWNRARERSSVLEEALGDAGA
jgi:hypothetical protein